MVRTYRKKQRVYNGGHKKFRNPRLFSGEKVTGKKKIIWPSLSFKKIVYSFVILFCFYYVLMSGNLKVKEVIVEGNHSIENAQIEKNLPVGKNLLLINISKIENDLKESNKAIKEVQIYKGFPNTLKVVIFENEGRAIWESNGSKYLVSGSGMVIQQLSLEEKELNLPLIRDKKNISIREGDIIVSSSFIAFTNNIKNQIFQITNIQPLYFEVVETTFDVDLYTEAGFFVKLDTTRSSAKQLDNLKRVLISKRNEIHEYVDLRVDGWAYYK